jgi:hypothetical protein
MKLKALWYCTKNKPYLLCEPSIDKNNPCRLLRTTIDKTIFNCIKENAINGKIVAVSDYEVEEITHGYGKYGEYYQTKTLGLMGLREHSCISSDKLSKYLKRGDEVSKVGYAIHIKNLHAFDKPRELSDFYIYDDSYDNMFGGFFEDREKYIPLKKAPQNMCYVYDKNGIKYVLISVRPEWLAMILNGLKDVELRRKVLKEML